MRAESGRLLAQDSHALPDALQHSERLLQFFVRMRRRHDGADARLTLWHRWERNAGAEHAFFKKFAGKVHGEFAVANNNRRNRSLARRCGAPTNIETQQTELFLPEARVLPEFLHALGFVVEHLEGRNARGAHRRWMRGRKQKRPCPVIKKIDQVARAANVSAERADCLRQRSHLDVHPPMRAEM